MGLCVSSHEKSEMRRRTMQLLSAEAKAAQLLVQMPGRLCTNGATKSCSLHTREGCKGINQDAMVAWEGFAAEEESVFCGVFDGHGPNGHMVASKVRDCLPSLLTAVSVEGLDMVQQQHHPHPHHHHHHHIHEPIRIFDINEAQKAQPGDGIVSELDCETNQELHGIKERFTSAFHKMDDHLRTHPKLSCMSSGSTAIAVLVQGKDLVVGSVGDSRAILARQHEDGSLVADQLTVELKPDSPGELERIEEHQGRVFALENEKHIARIWLPHSNTPGLAMSRAFGDFCLKDHGLIATPRISHRTLTKDDEFIVLATDGVWDVLSNKSVIDAVVSSASKEEAAQSVVDAAIRMWNERNLASRIDDCAVVCYFLKEKRGPTFTSPRISGKLKAKQWEEAGDGELERPTAAGEEEETTGRHLIRYDTLVSSAECLSDLEDVPGAP